MYGGDVEMQLWRGAEHIGCPAAELRDGGWTSGRQHHGQQAIREHTAIWHVQLDVQPGGRVGYCCRPRSPYADAVHSGDGRPVGRGCAHRNDRQHAGPEQFIETDLQLRRDYRNHDARVSDSAGAVRGPFQYEIL